MSWIDTPGYEATEILLQKTIDDLAAHNTNVYLLLDIPSAAYNTAQTIAMEALYGRKIDLPLVARKDYLDHRNQGLKPIIESTQGAVIIDPVDVMCPSEFCIVEDGGNSLYFDKGHLSEKGALYISPLFEPYFKRGGVSRP